MPPFSERTQAVLEAAGWNDSRRFDTAGYERTLAADGYAVSQPAREFLSSFGGLYLTSPGICCFDFDAPKHASHYFPEHAREIGRALRTALCVIGGDEPLSVLLMDGAGRVYLDHDDGVAYVAESGPAAIEMLCGGGPLDELHLFDDGE